MKHVKKWNGILAALCLALFVLALAGCGSSSSTAAPAALTGVTASASDRQVALNWTPVSTATSYNVYYGTSAGVTTATGTKVANLAGPSTVTGLTNGTTYYFVVTAVNSGGESPVSNEVSAMPVPAAPAQVKGISVSPGDTTATVSWTNATDAVSYNIYISTSATFTTTTNVLQKITGATNGQVINGLTNGTAYYFAVTAVNLGGESQLSAIKTTTPAVPVQIPTNPSAVTATAGVGQATITWGSVSNATSYTIYYLQAPASPQVAGSTVKAANNAITNVTSPYVVTGLTSGLNYWFVVTASNSAGEGQPQTNAKAASIQ